MTAEQLRAAQAPIKARYREDPAAALVTHAAFGELRPGMVGCLVKTAPAPANAGLHPAAGGDGSFVCSGDMLLQALVGCAGTTLTAVATAIGVPLRGGQVIAEGEVDFRGTLGVSKEVPVGFLAIRLRFALDTDAPDETLQKLLSLTERYCVVYQTLKASVPVTASVRAGRV
jgi:uncharacterized OsmC-like protein